MAKHNEFGKQGEQIAVDFLIDDGYTILKTNYRYLKAEIDIIAQKENTLAIVEVKARSSTFLEHIAETVTPKKIKLLVMATDYYVTENNLDVDVRFDIISILKKGQKFHIEHITDAFYHY